MTMQSSEVVVTGIGPVTSIGVGADALWDSLCAGRTAASTRKLPVDVGTTAELPMASMPPVTESSDLVSIMDFLEKEGCPGARDLAFSILASKLALADADLEYDRTVNNIGMVQAFEAPGVERAVAHLFGMLQEPPRTNGPPSVYDSLAPAFYNMQPFVYVHVLSKALGLHGYCTSLHNACTSGAFAIDAAARAIRAGKADIMIVVGGEAFDTAVRLHWFRLLNVYASDQHIRPFDTIQSGFFVGEGAGAIILESKTHAVARGARTYARFLASACAHQGWRQTAPDVKAARLQGVIENALSEAEVTADEVDLVVPHGAATSRSDKYEAMCLAKALPHPHDRALTTVFKPFIGHMLASCGIIESICALLSMQHGGVPANPYRPTDPMDLAIPLASSYAERDIATLLMLSTGFTGHDAAYLFRKA